MNNPFKTQKDNNGIEIPRGTRRSMFKNRRHTLADKQKDFYKNIDSLNFIDAKTIIAKRVEMLTLGQGFSLTSEDVDLQNKLTEWANINSLEDLLGRVMIELSLRGRVIMFLEPRKNGKVVISKAEPQNVNRVATVDRQNQIATLWYQPIKDERNLRLKVKITDKYIERIGYDDNKNQEVHLDLINEKLAPEQQIEARTDHNFGFLPVIAIYNNTIQPDQSFSEGMKTSWEELADTKDVAYLEDAANVAIREMVKETIVNHTRITGNFDNQEIKRLTKDKDTASSYFLDQVFIKSIAVGSEGKGSNITTDTPNLNLGEYNRATIDILNLYFNGSGLSSIFDGDNGASLTGGGETATGVLAGRELDYTTITKKKRKLQSEMTYILDLLMVAWGKEKTPFVSKRKYSFDLPLDLPMSPLQKLEAVRVRQELQLITRKEAVMEIHPNKDEAEVDAYIEELNKEVEREQEEMNAMIELGNQDQEGAKPKKSVDSKEARGNNGNSK